MSLLEIPDSLMDDLNKIGRESNRSAQQLAEEALRHYVAYEAYAIAQIKQGLAQAERGEFASEEEVERVLSKYDLPQ